MKLSLGTVSDFFRDKQEDATGSMQPLARLRNHSRGSCAASAQSTVQSHYSEPFLLRLRSILCALQEEAMLGLLRVLVAVAALSLPAHAAVEIGPAEVARLGRGEALVDVRIDQAEDAAAVSAAIDIQAAPEVVWAVMTDCERAPRFLPDLVSCRVLERDPAGAWDVREHMIDWAWFVPTIRNVFRSDYEPPHRLRFKRIDGDLKRSEGEWRLEPKNGGSATRVHYMALLAPSRLIPVSFALSSMRSDVPKVLQALRRECTTPQR